MSSRLTALVIGAGYAGQGHALALRDAGVEIVGMASRTEAVVRRVAEELGVPHASVDWRGSLEALRPDIVAVGTPGGTHVEMITAALEGGCHVFADKPLAPTAPEARFLWERAEQTGVRTAYAASYRYQPQAYLAARLIAAGAIGTVREVECVSHFNWPRLSPLGWSHRLDQGGGRLNNNFTHKLAIVLHALGGEVREATGVTCNDLRRAPIGPPVHDFREFTRSALTPEQAATAEWGAVDSDWSYTVLCRIAAAGQPGEPVSALFRHACLYPARGSDFIVFYGDGGTLHIDGAYAQGGVFLNVDGEWEDLPIPEDIRAMLPPIDDNTQRNWTQLGREFVRDVEGGGYSGYLTFRDGWIFQEVIDAVRAGAAYRLISGPLNSGM